MPEGCRVIFGPSDELKSTTISMIRSAKVEILFNMRYVTDFVISQELIEAQKRGVFVAGLLEARAAPKDKEYRSPQYFLLNKVPVAFWNPEGGYNQQRYMVVDEKLLAHGTYEWTAAAHKRDSTSLIIIANPAFALQFRNHFIDATEEAKLAPGSEELIEAIRR